MKAEHATYLFVQRKVRLRTHEVQLPT
eukprot:SAG25_NODE_3493_length_1062_cov_1.704050_1_plen_26_part_10